MPTPTTTLRRASRASLPLLLARAQTLCVPIFHSSMLLVTDDEQRPTEEAAAYRASLDSWTLHFQLHVSRCTIQLTAQKV